MAKSSNETVHTSERSSECGISNNQFNCDGIKISQHSDKKNFVCNMCSKKYDSKKALTFHQLTHNGATSLFQCNICQKSLSRKSNLNLHLKIHSGERPFECDICPKTYIHKHSWLNHLKSHNGDKAFACNKCNKKFIHRYELKSHMSKHEKLFVCNICKKCLSSQISLSGHLRLHTGETPFKCEFCGRQYAIERSLRKHIKRVHRFESSTGIRNKRFENDGSVKMKAVSDEIQVKNDDICIGNYDKRLITRELKVYLGEKISMSGDDSENKKIERERPRTRPPRERRSEKSASIEHDKPFECKVCRKKVTTKSNLTNHTKVHTREKTTNSKIRSANSKKNRLATPCTKQQVGKDMLVKVDAVENPSIFKEISEMPLLKVQSTIHNDDNSIVCDVCSRIFNRKSSLSNHIKVHIRKNPIRKNKRRSSIAAPTLKMFGEESESGLKNSRNNAHTEKLKEHCEEKMKKRNSSQCSKMLSSEIMNPSNISPSADITCNVCDRHFNRKSSLSNHIKVHTRDTVIKKIIKKDTFSTGTSKMHPSRKLDLANDLVSVHTRNPSKSYTYSEKSKECSGPNLPPKIHTSEEHKHNSTNNGTKKFKEYCPTTIPPRIINITEEVKSNRIRNSIKNVPTRKFKEYCSSTVPPRIISTTEEQKLNSHSMRKNVPSKKFREYCLPAAPPMIINTTEEEKSKPIFNRDNIPIKSSLRNNVPTKKFKEHSTPPSIINTNEDQKSNPADNRDNRPVRNSVRNNVPTKKFKEYCVSTAPPRIINPTEEPKFNPPDNRDNMHVKNSMRKNIPPKKFKEYCLSTALPRINSRKERKSNSTNERGEAHIENSIKNNVPTEKFKENRLSTAPPTDNSHNVLITHSMKNNVHTKKFKEYCLPTALPRITTSKETKSNPPRVQTSEHPFESVVPSIKIEEDHFLIERSSVPTAEESFVCFTCHGKFDAEIDLIKHLRLHTSEKSSEPHILIDQIKEEHSNQETADVEVKKPFKCYTCHKTFDQQVSLTLHLRLHISGEAIQFGVSHIKLETNSDSPEYLSVHNNSELHDDEGGSLAPAGAYCITDIIKDECSIEIEYNELI